MRDGQLGTGSSGFAKILTAARMLVGFIHGWQAEAVGALASILIHHAC